MNNLSRLLNPFLVLFFFVSFTQAVQGDTDSATKPVSQQERNFEQRLKSVDALTDALDRIRKEKKSDKEVEATIEQIHQLVKEARELKNKGEIENGLTVLNKAYVMAKVGIEQLRQGDILVNEFKGHKYEILNKNNGDINQIPYSQQNFELKLKIVDALTDTLDRIRKEKNTSKDAEKTIEQIHQLATDARRLTDAGEADQGQAALDKAYITAKVGIEQLQYGDSSAMALKFSSKKENFDYAIERNDTHRMLVGILLNKGSSTPDPIIKESIIRSAEFRRQANQQGEAGNFSEAILILEDSTMELIKAIRKSGIFVPG